jgi:hypothetical protein
VGAGLSVLLGGGGDGRFLWLLGFQKGVKNFVGEDSVFVIEVVFGFVFGVYVKPFYCVLVCAFFVVCSICIVSWMVLNGCAFSCKCLAKFDVRLWFWYACLCSLYLV